MKSEPPLIHASVSNHIGIITLNNPSKRNCLSSALIDGICEALVDMQKDEVRVVILRAPAGSQVFSAGHDISELPTNGRDPLTYTDPLRHLVRTIEHFRAPVVAMVEGSVWGGACELVMSCDMVIAAEDSTFAITTTKLGVPYNMSGIQNFMNSGGMLLCKEMLFTSQPLGAKRLVDRGIVNYAVPRGELEATTLAVAEQIAKNSPLAISLLKEELRLLSASHNLSPETFERVQSMRREVYDSEDYQEGIRAFHEKRIPRFRGR
jgi:methylmalonyl-CoA decarboxylase